MASDFASEATSGGFDDDDDLPFDDDTATGCEAAGSSCSAGASENAEATTVAGLADPDPERLARFVSPRIREASSVRP
jgi:hypothetical protein